MTRLAVVGFLQSPVYVVRLSIYTQLLLISPAKCVHLVYTMKAKGALMGHSIQAFPSDSQLHRTLGDKIFRAIINQPGIREYFTD